MKPLPLLQLKITKNSSIAWLFNSTGQLIPLSVFGLLITILHFFLFINFFIYIINFNTHFFKYFDYSTREGLIFTLLITNFEFLAKAVKAIKNALELISEGIL